MNVEIVMPQMGESITEGTISKWLKQVGETIARDEPLLEISTDKVDAEVPSPEAGVLLEIKFDEGETVEVDNVIAVLGAERETPAVSFDEQKDQPKESGRLEAKTQTIHKSTESSAEEMQIRPVAPSSSEVTEVVMPQMGESITEGTISKWLKVVGDKIERDEPLLEISTDKVDAEVPSPVEGTLLEIKVAEGETVEVDSVVALIGAEYATPVKNTESIGYTEIAEPKSTSEETNVLRATSQPSSEAVKIPANGHDTPLSEHTVEELRRVRSSPLVRNIAKEHNIDISQISGSGMNKRVTKKDILAFIDSGKASRPRDLPEKTLSETSDVAAPPHTRPDRVSDYKIPQIVSQVGDRTEPMSVMRKKIAEHMTLSKQTSAHVTSVYEIDMTKVVKFRQRSKADFQARYDTKLTYMPFIFKAVTSALQKFPILNAQVSGDQIIYKGNINLGMAVALDWGLIVPVIKQADALSLPWLAKTANDLANRARVKKLMPDEVSGGTFTVTNPGVFGGLFGTPIINQPQVAILCLGTIEKRPKIITTPEGEDYIGIRHLAYFALTYDHRIVNGADAEQFLSYIKEYLENKEFGI